MPVHPLRGIQNKRLARLVNHPSRLTSTPKFPSQKDLLNFGSGIPAIPELESPVLAAPTKPQPKMNEINNTKKLPVLQMICEAIKAIGDRKGASVPAIKKFLIGHFCCEDGTRLNNNIKKALLKGTENGTLERPKNSQTGARGFFKVNKKKPKAPAETKDQETEAEKPIKKQDAHKTKETKKSTKQADQPKSTSNGTKKTKASASATKTEKTAESGNKKPEEPAKQTKKISETNKSESKKSKKTSKKPAAKAQNSKNLMHQEDSDPEKTLKAPEVNDSQPSRGGSRRRKLSSAASDTEVTLVKQDVTNIVRNRMNFSDSMSMSMMAREKLGRTLKMTSSSAKLKKAKRLSLKTSKKKRPETTRKPVAQKTRQMPNRKNNYTETSVPPNSPAETSVPKVSKNGRKRTKDRLRDLSADSILKPNSRKRNLRRKSSV